MMGSLLKERLLNTTVLAGFAAAFVMSVPTIAFAQEDEPDVEADEPTVEEIEEDEGDERMLVTGSRIARQGFADITQPAVTIDSEFITARGFTNVADAINQIPGVGVGVDGIGESGQNVGQEFVDLFDLGTSRTLVVVNGRRFVSGNVPSSDPNGRVDGGQVDLNNIPLGLIERVEVLSVGGAPIYGADAIAGTVNVILKDDYEGFEANFQYGDRFNVGDGTENYTVNALAGANFDNGRGNVTASVQYELQNGAIAAEFPFLSTDDRFFVQSTGLPSTSFATVNALTSAGLPTTVEPGPFGTTFPIFNTGAGTLATNAITDPATGGFLQFSNDGRLIPFDPGADGGTAVQADGGDGFRFFDFEEAIAPVERFVFSSTAKYDVNDHVTFFMETNVLTSSATDLVNQPDSAFQSGAVGGASLGPIEIGIDNPFLNPADAAILAPQVGDSFFLHEVSIDLLEDPGSNFVDTTTIRLVGGIEGEFDFANRNFRYEVSYNFGRTTQFRQEGAILDENFANAVQPTLLTADSAAALQAGENVAAVAGVQAGSTFVNVLRDGEVVSVDLSAGQALAGDIVCSVFLAPPAPDADPALGLSGGGAFAEDPGINGCTPFNPLGFGLASPQAIDFVSTTVESNGEINQRDFLAFVTGDVVDLPAGTVQATLGFERRREFGSFDPGGVLGDGLSRLPTVAPLEFGETTSTEFFMETSIPVLNSEFNLGINKLVGFELISSLEFNGAYRRISQDLAGDSNVYTAGGFLGLWNNNLRLRGNFTRSVRAPSITELFQPLVPTLSGSSEDPCDDTNINISAGGEVRGANCVAAAQALGFTEAALVESTIVPGGVALALNPGDTGFNAATVNASIIVSQGGNPGLANEIADSFTGGVIFQPNFIPGLTVGADYISISVVDLIEENDLAFFTNTCFDSPGLSDPACGNFIRSPDSFEIIDGTVGFANTGLLTFRAVQAQVNYQFDVLDMMDIVGLDDVMDLPGDLGNVSWQTIFFIPIEQRSSALFSSLVDDEGLPVNVVGNTTGPNQPNVEFQNNFFYNYRKFTFLWQTDFNGGVDVGQEFTNAPPGSRVSRDIEFNATVGYEFSENLQAQFVINDIFNNTPTLEQDIFGGNGSNVLGRSFFARISYRH